MKKLLFGIFLLVFTFSLAGCFEIIEEITLNDDGSGHIDVTLNISRSKTKLNSIMLMDSINSYKVPSRADIKENMELMVKEIRKIEGVSNVQHQMDFDNFIFSVSCDFLNVEVLNKVITHFSSDREAKKLISNKQFTFDPKKKLFRRNYHYNLSREVDKVKSKDRKILDGASVTTIYRFQSPIESCENPDSKVSGSRKAVMLKVDVEDMIADRKNIKNTVKLN